MSLAAWQVGEVVFTMLWFACFFIWIWLLISVFGDIFRSHDMGGVSKAIWTLFVIVLPMIGVLIYLIARGDKMAKHNADAAKAQEAAMKDFIRNAGGTGTAEELERLAGLKASGVLSAAEFDAQKAKLLA